MIIYKTTNLINGKIYIGQDSNNNGKYIGSGKLLILAIKKYGITNFKKEVLETCIDKSELDDREMFWIKYFNSMNRKIGYNISEGGTGGKLVPFDGKKGKSYDEFYGIERSKEIKKLLSEKRKNIILPIMSKETKDKISISNKGKVRSDEVKDSIRTSLLKYFNTSDGLNARENLKNIKKNSTLSESHKRKISDSMKENKIKPKKLDIHPSSKYWFFYDRYNNLILEILGGRTAALKELKTNQRRIIIFTDLDECLSYELDRNKDYKIFTKKYYT